MKTKKELVKRAALYLRVSTERQAKRNGGDREGFSIPAQRDEATRRVRAIGAKVVAEFSDPGSTGGNPNRPGLQELLKRIREVGDIDYVVVWKLSRFSRSPLFDEQIFAEFAQRGVKLISVSENFDETTPSGRMTRRIVGAVNGYDLEVISENVKLGISKKVQYGGTLGYAPLGYVNSHTIIDGHEVKIVVLDPDRADLIRWLFEAYATGNYSLSMLTKAAQERGLRSRPTKHGPGRPLPRNSLARILTNPYYTGSVVHLGVEHPGKHEPLISRELFDRVQATLKVNANGEKVQKHPHYLKGSLYCPRCWSRYSMCLARGKLGDIYPYFFCLGRAKGNDCDQPYLPVDKVEQDVAGFYDSQRLDPEIAEKLRIDFRVVLKTEHARLIKDAAKASKRLEELKDERQKFLELYYRDAITVDLVESEQTRINQEMAAARAIAGEATGEYTELLPPEKLNRQSHCDPALGARSSAA